MLSLVRTRRSRRNGGMQPRPTGYGPATGFRECVLWRSEAEAVSRHLEDSRSRLREWSRRPPAEWSPVSSTNYCPPHTSVLPYTVAAIEATTDGDMRVDATPPTSTVASIESAPRWCAWTAIALPCRSLLRFGHYASGCSGFGPKCTRIGSGHSANRFGVGLRRINPNEGKAMANKAHRHSRRSRSFRNRFEAHWLLVLLARTLASIAVMVVARLLGFTTYGGH
jgi:hypothetical protein